MVFAVANITERYTSEIAGVLTCYDRMIIQGYIVSLSYTDAMTCYLNANQIKIFGYQKFFEPLTKQVHCATEELMKYNKDLEQNGLSETKKFQNLEPNDAIV